MKINKKKISIEVDVNVERDGKEFHAWCPEFKGLHMDGKTKKEVLKNVDDAVLAYILSYIKHGELKIVKNVNRKEAWTVKFPIEDERCGSRKIDGQDVMNEIDKLRMPCRSSAYMQALDDVDEIIKKIKKGN